MEYGPNENTQYAHFDAFSFEDGSTLPITIAYRTWGQLNDARDTAILVCHALTGDANADQLWAGIVGPGLGLDTSENFVVCSNVIGGCYGSSGPTTLNPETGTAYGPDFPAVTIRDMVNAQRRLMDHLTVPTWRTITGGSLGGMQTLEWAISYPELVRSIVPIAVGPTHSDWAIGINHVQREVIRLDPLFLDGRYAPDNPPARGLSVARQLGMISYRSHGSYAGKFNRSMRDGRFEVQHYLEYQGAAMVKRFDANTFITLSTAMNGHDVGRGRESIAAALGSIAARALVIGITSDVLFPVVEQRELAAGIPDAEFEILEGEHGHDSFLIDTEKVSSMIATFLLSI